MPEIMTPVQLRNGRWYKREDCHRGDFGVNGSKLRACQHLLRQAVDRGAKRIISASSVLSPQSAMAAVVARDLGIPCTLIYGATRPETIMRHAAPVIAATAGGQFEYVPVGFNPYLQRAALIRAAAEPGAYVLNYGITPPLNSSQVDIAAFHFSGAQQVANLPLNVETLVIPFGSGNTAAGVLYGLSQYRNEVRRVVLVGIGPSRLNWLRGRLDLLGARLVQAEIEHIDLHGLRYATYQQRMPGNADGIELHPTYEGKVVRYLDETQPSWWTRRDGSTGMWIVGGSIGVLKEEAA